MQEIVLKMMEINKHDPKRIHHFLKVHAFASIIAEDEQLDEKVRDIIEISSYMHDIGIPICEKKYGKCPGNLQEIEGAPLAKEVLKELGYEEEVIERVCYLIAHHHTYNEIDGIDYQILIEADFLVNAYEDELSVESIQVFKDKYLKTKMGIKILEEMY